MTRTEIENAITTAIQKCADRKGWANLAELGPHLKSEGVKYGKLKKFLGNYPDLLDTKIDYTTLPPVVYARIRK